MKATARHPLGLLRVASAPPPPPPAASCSGCGPRREAMDAASGLPPSHMFTQNAVPDDGIDHLVDRSRRRLPFSPKLDQRKQVLCCASAAVDCMPACSCASVFVLAPVEKGMQVTTVFSSSGSNLTE